MTRNLDGSKPARPPAKPKSAAQKRAAMARINAKPTKKQLATIARLRADRIL